MSDSRRLIATFTAIAISSLSCGAMAPRGDAPRPAPTELVVIPAEFSAEAKLAARVLERLRTGLASKEITQVAVAVVTESRRAGLPVDLVLAVIQVESSGNTFAVSSAGALGLMQLLPATAEDVAQRIGFWWNGPAILFDPVLNVRLGVTYLGELVQRYGDVNIALAAYNWGPTRISSRLRRGETIPVAYAVSVKAVQGQVQPRFGSI